jgi:hypothetical protein
MGLDRRTVARLEGAPWNGVSPQTTRAVWQPAGGPSWPLPGGVLAMKPSCNSLEDRRDSAASLAKPFLSMRPPTISRPHDLAKDEGWETSDFLSAGLLTNSVLRKLHACS